MEGATIARVPFATPAWSPDGGTILFTVGEFTPEGPAIWSVAAGGGDARILIAEGAHPAWSPDGERLAFERPEAASSQDDRPVE